MIKSKKIDRPYIIIIINVHRYSSLFSSRVDSASKIPRTAGYRLVAGHFAVRHGLRRHPFWTRRPDCTSHRQLCHQNSGTTPFVASMRRPNPSLLGISSSWPANIGADSISSLDESGNASTFDWIQTCSWYGHAYYDSGSVHVSSTCTGLNTLQSRVSHVAVGSLAEHGDGLYDNDGHSGSSTESPS